jgi:serine/threonine protein kinase
MSEASRKSADSVGTSTSNYGLGSCRSVEEYRKVNRIGEGTYGFVYRAVHRTTGTVVALKRIILHNENQDGFPLTSLREVKTLNACRNHPHVIQLHEVVVGPNRDAVFLLFEYCEHDLSTLLKAFKAPFKESEIKCLAKQLLSAVEHIHSKWVVHRDIKLSNLLYNSKGQLKLADFGLARTLSYPAPAALTQTVVTLWYRAPEVLLGATNYSFPIDVWSVGCILGELLLNQPLLPGSSELDQIRWIFHLMGE